MSNAGDGVLFKGLSFFCGQRVPSRSKYIELIRRNGGEIRPLEKNADIRIADHVRRSQNAPGTVSYEWIDKSIEAATLLDLEDFPAGPSEAAPRPVGAGTLRPAKASRNPYSADDDAFLRAEMTVAERRGVSLRGNELFKQIEAKNSRHPWQSWRDRWIKYVSKRTSDSTDETSKQSDKRTTTASPAPAEVRTSVVKKTTARPSTRSPIPARLQLESNPDFSIIIPHFATPDQSVKTSTTRTKPATWAGFTNEEDELLMDAAEAIENTSVRKYDRAWELFGKSYTRHTTEEWKHYYETKIRPIYRLSAPDSAAEEEGNELDEVQVSEMLGVEDESAPTKAKEVIPAVSPFVELMKRKTPSPGGSSKRKRDSPQSSPLGRSSEKSTAKKLRSGKSSRPSKLIDRPEAAPNTTGLAIDTRINLADLTSEVEEEDDEDLAGPRLDEGQELGGHHLTTKVFPHDSQPWEGLSPEKNLGFKIYGSQDEFSEEGVENAMLNTENMSPVPRQTTRIPIPGALQVFDDNPQDFLLSKGTQEESQEFYDASQGIGSSMDIVPKVAAIPTPDLLKKKTKSIFDLGESEVEDSRSSFERDEEEIAAQLARENAYHIEDGNLADEDEDELEAEEIDADDPRTDDEDEDDKVMDQNGSEKVNDDDYEDTPRQARHVVTKVPIPDSDAILPPDESAAEDQRQTSPSPRKAQTHRRGPFRDQDTSDLEDYTEMPLPQDSDIGNMDADKADADVTIPSMERYADTQAVLQGDTQSLDTDLPLPPAASQTMSQWLQEERSQIPNSDIVPSSPGPRIVARSVSRRTPAKPAIAVTQPRTSNELFFGDNDEEKSEDGFEPVAPQATLPTPKPSRSPAQRRILDDESYHPSADDQDGDDDALPKLDDALKMVRDEQKIAPPRQVHYSTLR